MFLTDRDCLISAKRVVMDDGRKITICRSCEHPDYPETNETIRVQYYSVSAAVPSDDGNGSQIMEFSNSDGMGWIPP